MKYNYKPFKLILIFLLSLSLISCSSNSDRINNNNNTNNQSQLLRKEFFNSGWYNEYWYDTNDLLTKIKEINVSDNYDIEINFSYDSNDNISQRNVINLILGRTSTTAYYYDTDNRLVTSLYSDSDNRSKETNYTYIGNIIDVNIDTGNEESTVNLETNSNGLISKIIYDLNSYSAITYDSNGNPTNINTVIDGILTHDYNYSYDQKNNPFFGQLKSLYIPQFLYINKDLEYGEDLIYPDYGYDFPFLNNNLIKLESFNNLDTNFPNQGEEVFTYNYNEHDYPVFINYEFNGNLNPEMKAYEYYE